MSDIRQWLEELGLGQYADAFEENEIGIALVPSLDHEVLKDIGVSVAGHRLKILEAAKVFAQNAAVPQSEQLSEAEAAESAAKPRPATAERRQITVMFCDLVGSTALSEKLDPEDLREVMTAYQKACGAVVERYEGHVAQYLGDGLMTYFGWPRAHEDDAQRAVRAGLDIVAAVQGLEAPVKLSVRVGISTGLVVVGETGAGDAAVPKAAVGETPNVAARVQGLAEPDTVTIGEATRRLIGGAFKLEDLGAQTLKGVAAPLHVFRVTGESDVETRFDASRGAGLTPLVGRDEELGLLVKRWEQAKDGEGQVLLLSGEAGIGKSRIIQALRERVMSEPHTRLRYQCSPYYINSAFYPVIDQLERAAGFARDDGSEQKLDKLETLLAQSGDDVADIAPLFAAMLSLPIDRYPPLNLTPQKQKENTIAALADQVALLAAQQPVLMIFEDAHWIDPTTLETLGVVIDRLQDSPVFLVMTYRPEFEPRWAGHGHVTTLALNRLSRSQGAEMVAGVTSGKKLPNEVLDQIIAKTDGVPLFVEELTKTVLEAGFLKEEDELYTLDGPLPPLAIPATLQDSLMARLDRLSPIKEVAQISAVIGREFAYELLSAVSPLRDNELEDALTQLVNSGLIFRHGQPPEATYSFKHAMVQDAAYESLLKSKRQQFHQRIASVLQDQFEQTVQTHPELLAHHLTQAGNHDQAIPYWYQAGQLAFVASAFAEGAAHIQNGLKLLPQIGDERAQAKIELGLQTLLGSCYMSMYGLGVDPVIDAFGRAERLLDHAENATEVMPILSAIGTYHWVRGNFLKADGYLYRMSQVAEEAHDEDLLVPGRTIYGAFICHMGRLAESVGLLKSSLNDYDPTRHRDLSIRITTNDSGIGASAWMALTQCFLGYPDQAWAQAQRTVEIARDIRHPISTALGLSMTALGAVFLARAEAALAWAEEGITFCEEQSIPFWLGWAKISRGAARGLLGDADGGIEDLKWAGTFLDSMGCRFANGWINKQLAEIFLSQGKLDDAEDSIRRLYAHVEQSGEALLWPTTHRLAAEIDFTRNGAKAIRAEGLLQDALRVAREQENRLTELHAAMSLARLWQAQNKTREAQDMLAPVYDWFTEGFDTADLKEAKALLEELK